MNDVFANNYNTFAQLCFRNLDCKEVAKSEHLKKKIIVNFFFADSLSAKVVENYNVDVRRILPRKQFHSNWLVTIAFC